MYIQDFLVYKNSLIYNNENDIITKLYYIFFII